MPSFGVIAYFAFRPGRPTEEMWHQPSASDGGLNAQRSDNTVMQVETLARLRSQRALTVRSSTV